MSEFEAFPKIPRLKRGCVITEKLDGTNAQIFISEDGFLQAGSRNRYIGCDDDNYGFAKWCAQNIIELTTKLGPGRHFGEWWGQGIQRGYGLEEKRFSLFNTGRWNSENIPACCSIVPVLYQGEFDTREVDAVLTWMRAFGSKAAPGFMQPEGIVIYHAAAGSSFKVTLDNDARPKGVAA